MRRALVAVVVVLAAIVGLSAGGDRRVPGAATAFAAGEATSAYRPVGPLRLADTRQPVCGCSRLDANTISIDVAGRPAVPDDALAAAVTVTALSTATAGFVTAYPGGSELPPTSTVNTRWDRVVANSAIIPIGPDGTIEVFSLVPTHIVVDITGVFVPMDRARDGRFVPVAPRRLIDTRLGGGAALAPGADLPVPRPPEAASDATALVVNVTSLLESRPGHLSARPTGQQPATSSFLNANGTGQALASSVILPISPDGLTIRTSGGGHLVVDLVGWFTGPSASESADGLFVPLAPTRLLDTREQRPRIWPGGTIELASPVAGASALATNLTITNADRRGHVTAYPAGTTRPFTSAINPAMHDHTLANMAITRISDRGAAYYAHAGVDAVVDLTGYFTGAPATASSGPAPNQAGRSRVLLVGDSTLASLGVYTDGRDALLGFEPIVDAQSCRRLLRPSCHSRVTNLTPNTAVEAILGTPGVLDIVVVKAGYNDWFSDFPVEFHAVVEASRIKGAHTIVWLSYNEDVARENARRAYHENNVDLYQLARLPQYGDVLLADWLTYSRPHPQWFDDGTHAGREGTYAIADYVSRWVAAIEHKPCPRPWWPGQPSPDPCPNPDLIGAPTDVMALYGR